MSASLVGSDLCIRARDATAPPAPEDVVLLREIRDELKRR
jgi:large-conductance mechanosensitive channel